MTAERAGDERQDEVASQDVSRRAAFVLLLLVAVGIWCWFHLGRTFSLAIFGATFVALAAVWKQAVRFVDSLFGKPALERVRDRLRVVVQRRLTWRVLFLAAALVLAAGGSVASIAVVPDTVGDTVRVRVSPYEQPDATTERTLDGSRDPVRFHRLARPWGRAFAVSADGYASGTFTVYPFVPRQVRLVHDVALIPTLVLRPGPEGLSALGDGAVLRVHHETGNGDPTLIAADSGRQASFLVGAPRALPSAVTERWTADVTHLGAVGERIMLELWGHRAALTPVHPHSNEGDVRAEIVHNGRVVSRGAVRLAPVRLIDVFLKDLPPTEEGPP